MVEIMIKKHAFSDDDMMIVSDITELYHTNLYFIL